jgi:hypothetical protein
MRSLEELAPVSGDDQKQAAKDERDACDNASRGTESLLRNGGGGEPGPGKQDVRKATSARCTPV